MTLNTIDNFAARLERRWVDGYDPDGTLTLATAPFALNGSVSVQELKWRRA